MWQLIKKSSPTYKKWVAVELSADNKRQLLIPRGFGHGFVTLTDDVEFLYKADNYYDAASDRSILWCDEELAINWSVDNPIISEKDSRAPRLCDSDVDFKYNITREKYEIIVTGGAVLLAAILSTI